MNSKLHICDLRLPRLSNLFILGARKYVTFNLFIHLKSELGHACIIDRISRVERHFTSKWKVQSAHIITVT